MSIVDRFLGKIKVNNSCWEWVACKSVKGYGRFNIDGVIEMAHRVSYKLFKGEIPECMCVLHRCDNPRCVNPEHLFLGTVQDNNADRDSKGRTHRPVGEENKRAKINRYIAEKIREEYKSGDLNTYQLGDKYGISNVMVGKIVRGKSWSILFSGGENHQSV